MFTGAAGTRAWVDVDVGWGNVPPTRGIRGFWSTMGGRMAAGTLFVIDDEAAAADERDEEEEEEGDVDVAACCGP